MKNSQIKNQAINFEQIENGNLRIYGYIDGLYAGKEHRLTINTFGDMRDGCSSAGKVFRSTANGAPEGDLGTVKANQNGTAVFNF